MKKNSNGLITDTLGHTRCWWCGDDPLYVQYHDMEWGVPQDDDQSMFEKIVLEGFQSGLSWLTILRKRENFRRAFRDFDVEAVARFNRRSVDRLLNDAGIVRNRLKIEATIKNAGRAIELIEEFGSLAAFFRKYEPKPGSRPSRITKAFLMAHTTSTESIALSKDLKKRGWSFVGPTTMYAHMQAMGMVNDHIEGCQARKRVAQSLRKLHS